MLLQGISLPSPLGEGLGVRLFPLGEGLGVRPFYFFLSAFFPSFSLTLQLLSGLFAAVYADKCVLDN